MVGLGRIVDRWTQRTFSGGTCSWDVVLGPYVAGRSPAGGGARVQRQWGGNPDGSLAERHLRVQVGDLRRSDEVVIKPSGGVKLYRAVRAGFRSEPDCAGTRPPVASWS